MINLYMALFWLVVGIICLTMPGVRDYEFLDWGIRFGWFPIGLVGYNLLRWLVWLVQQRRHRFIHHNEPPKRQRDYNPEFDFTEDPPQPK